MKTARTIRSLALITTLGLLGTACVIRPTHSVAHPQPVTVAQPAPVYVTQPTPVVVQPAPVVVSRPAPVVVYRSASYVYRTPSPVVTPVRYYAPGVTAGYRQVCVPGTTRACEAYCGHGVRRCNAMGTGWGACMEGVYY